VNAVADLSTGSSVMQGKISDRDTSNVAVSLHPPSGGTLLLTSNYQLLLNKRWDDVDEMNVKRKFSP
jgi:hypothetical protein